MNDSALNPEPAALRRARRAITADLKYHVDRWVRLYGEIPDIESKHIIDADGSIHFRIKLSKLKRKADA